MNNIGISYHQELLTSYRSLLDFNSTYTLVAFFENIASNKVFLSVLEELIEFTSEESMWLKAYTESLKKICNIL